MMMAGSGSRRQIASADRNAREMRESEVDAGASVADAVKNPPPAQLFKLKPGPTLAIPSDNVGRRGWWSALALSLLLHGVIAGAMLLNWSFSKADEAPPAASMIVELAVMPASPPVQPNEIAPGPEQVEAAPMPKPQDAMKFDPPPQVDPALSPNFALPVKEEQKPTETKVVARDARETTAPRAVPAPVEDKNAAPVEGNNSAPPSDAEQAWEGRILAKLERSKRYPAAAQSAGQQDTVFVRLVIDRKGGLIAATLKRSGGFQILDAETLALAKRASPFPAPPDSVVGAQIVRVIPIEFYIKKRR